MMLLTVGIVMQLSATGFAQSVKMTGGEQTLKAIFEQVEQQTGKVTLFSNNELDMNKTVELEAGVISLENLYSRLLQGMGLSFEITDMYVVIRKAKPVDARSEQEKPITVSGLVTDEDKQPIPGVTVLVKGVSLGTVTDVDGRYKLVIPNLKEFSLVFTFVGMESQEIKYTGQDTINVVMKEEAEALDEVVVTGYQNIKKHEMTGAAQVIKMDDIKVAGVNTIDQMLQGRIPGMIFMQNSGQVGAAPKLRIRGSSTMLGSQEPLWVLDGVVLSDPVNVDPAQLNDLDFVNLLGNAIAGLNPDDIEQITVLKDAAATALYGARAGNGVIVITTKKGKAGPPSVTYSVTGTYTRRPRYTDKAIYLMNSKERVDVSRELIERGIYYSSYDAWTGYEAIIQDYYNGKIDFEEYNEQVGYYETLNTDWFDLICRDAFSHNHTLSLSGGASNISYYASLGLTDDNGTIKGENNKRYSAMLKLSANYERFALQFQVQGNVTSRDYNPSELGVMDYAYSTSRAIPAFNPDGSRYTYPRTNMYSMAYDFNILNEMDNSADKTKGSSINTQAHLQFNVLKDLRVEGTLSYAVSNTNQEVYFTEDTYYVFGLRANQATNSDLCPVGGEFRETNTRNVTWMARLQANWAKNMGKDGRHNLSASAGLESNSSKYNTFNITRRGFSLERGKTFLSVPTTYTMYYANFMQSSAALGVLNENLSNTLAWYAMVGYGYDNRFLFNVHLRSETSNLFGTRANDEFMPIWAVSARWNMKRDVLKNVDWIDDVSLRGSFGYQGNMLNNQTTEMIIQKGGNDDRYGNRATVVNFANPDLKWEKTASTNVTLDFSLLNNKINGSVSYYYKKTKDAFMTKTVSEINGKTEYVVNSGTLENQGVELAFNFTPINQANIGGGKRGFVWRIDPQLGQVLNNLINKAINNRNNVLRDEITYDDMLTGNVEFAGTPLNTFYSYRFKGLSHEDGSPIFYGTEEELKEEYMEEYSQMEKEDVFLAVMEKSGRREPYIQGGISNYFGYRQLGLSFNLTYSLGNKVRLLKLCSEYGLTTPYPQDNMRREFVKRWRKPGDEEFTNIPGLRINELASTAEWWQNYPATAYQFAGNRYEMYDNSDLRVVSGNFLRLSSLSLRYNVEDRICQKLGLKSAYINLTGTNLFTWANKKLKGQDPTQSGSAPNVNISVRPSFSCNLSITF